MRKKRDRTAPQIDTVDVSALLVKAFSRDTPIGLTISDNRQRFESVNSAVVAMHDGIPAEAFVGKTMRDMIGDAAPAPEARLRRVLVLDQTPAVEVTAMLPARGELGYWIEKQFTIPNRAGRGKPIASLAVEVTADRKLDEYFRNLAGGLLSTTNEEYQRLARELHDSVQQYHAGIAMSLERLSRGAKDPERIPELLAPAIEFLDEGVGKLASALARCFPFRKPH